MRVESERDLLRERLSQLQDDPGLKLQPYMTLERNTVRILEEIDRGGWGVVSEGKVRSCYQTTSWEFIRTAAREFEIDRSNQT